MTTIREISSKDLDSLLVFLQKVSHETIWANYLKYTIVNLKTLIETSQQDETIEYNIALNNDKIIGQIFTAIIPNTQVAEISSFVIRNAYKGAGVSKDLLSSSIQFAKNNGVKAVILYVRVNNTRAITFYKNNGFVFKDRYNSDGKSMLLEYPLDSKYIINYSELKRKTWFTLIHILMSKTGKLITKW